MSVRNRGMDITTIVGLSIGRQCSLKRSLRRRLVSQIYCRLHVDNIESVASYLGSDFIDFSCGMESIFITTVIKVRAGGTVPSLAPKRTGSCTGVV